MRLPELRIDARERRTLLIGIVAVPLLLLTSRGVPAWRAWKAEMRAQAAEAVAEHHEVEALIARLPTMEDSAHVRLSRAGEAEKLLLRGNNSATAGASLAGILSEAARRSGMSVDAVTPRPGTAGAAGIQRVSAATTITGDIAGLTSFLAIIEAGPALLLVRDLQIDQPEPAAARDRPESLRASILVQGLVRAAVAPVGGGSE
jgi:hypothetical protein